MARVKSVVAMHKAVDLALLEGVEHPLIQSGQVFGETACYGCGFKGTILFDAYGAWCPSCGGAALVPGALDLDYGPLTSGKATIGGSRTIHLVESPRAKNTLCLPQATIGRMRESRADVSCDRCLAVRDAATLTEQEKVDV